MVEFIIRSRATSAPAEVTVDADSRERAVAELLSKAEAGTEVEIMSVVEAVPGSAQAHADTLSQQRYDPHAREKSK